jgi:mutator protein MutT
MEERYTCKIVTDLMLTRKNKTTGAKEILLSLRKNTGYRDGEYELPGGHVEEGEDLMQAMVREAREELMLEVKEEDLKIVHILHHYKGNRINFILTTNNYEGEPGIGEPDKCERIEWFDIKHLPENVMAKVKTSIEEINKGIFYSKL